MKVSVLLPTRDGLKYLPYAIESVQGQEASSLDWEVVVSDNNSDQDVTAYVDSLKDARVIVSRSDRVLPVTENWNRALEMSTGDYVIMLGDDDCLMPGCMTTLERLISEFENPDVIYSGAHLFAYPGAVPGSETGWVQPYGYASFLQAGSAGWVEPAETQRMVHEVARMKTRFGFNMQFATLSRSFLNTLAPEGFRFKTPFPDYYAMCVFLLKARGLVACPQSLVLIGITPKSYGAFHASGRSSEGLRFLMAEPERGQQLPCSDAKTSKPLTLVPGNAINDNWLTAICQVAIEFPEGGLQVDRKSYLRRQAQALVEASLRTKSAAPVRQLRSFVSFGEWFSLITGAAVMLAIRMLTGPLRHVGFVARWRGRFLQFPDWHPDKISGFADPMEVIAHLSKPERLS
ncbi:MAG: glycosyltransferase family 2 protein [Actinomycetota bacterium]|nr:glycosyltransferase [Actinomycetota bacterium]